MISEIFRLKFGFINRKLIFSCFLSLASIFSISCNQPFQPETRYTPRLNVYSLLLADSHGAYVKVLSVSKSSGDVSMPVHGATVTLALMGPYGGTLPPITLVDTTAVIGGDSASFYYAPIHIMAGYSYSVSVTKSGYPTVTASAGVPVGYATIPDAGTYSILRYPKNIKSAINFNIALSPLAAAEFVQMRVEYRGLDSAGNFRGGSFNVFPVDSVDPFSEITAPTVPLTVDTTQYQRAYAMASNDASLMKVSHMYADIIVTQVDDSFYRFFITSARTLDPLQMRTDKLIFSNVFNNNGTGIVAGVSIDTTRIFLF